MRQFLDTRRSHIATVVDSDKSSYRDDDEFELAISAAASVAVQAVLDEQPITVSAGGYIVPGAPGSRVLDTFSRAEATQRGLVELAARTAVTAPDISIALLVTGANVPFSSLLRAASYFAPEVNTLALRIDPSEPTGIAASSRLTVLSLRVLAEFAPLMRGTMP